MCDVHPACIAKACIPAALAGPKRAELEAGSPGKEALHGLVKRSGISFHERDNIISVQQHHDSRLCVWCCAQVAHYVSSSAII